MDIQLSKCNYFLRFAAHPLYLRIGFERTGRTTACRRLMRDVGPLDFNAQLT
jgi:hypothetical protein